MGKMPILIYDNLCTSCTYYAKFVNLLVKQRIVMVGHYTPQGEELKRNVFPKEYDGLEMFWFVTENCAYGGRSGLFQLTKYIFFSKKNNKEASNHFDMAKCTTDCKTAKMVFIRSCSILLNSKKIAIR